MRCRTSAPRQTARSLRAQKDFVGARAEQAQETDRRNGGTGAPSLPQCRLCRRQPGDRYAEGRTTHVVQADLVTELDAVGVAAVLAADADLEVTACAAALLDADLHQPADTVKVDCLERIARHQVVL